MIKLRFYLIFSILLFAIGSYAQETKPLSQDPLIQQMVNQVSEDNIRTTIRTLQSFGTRYAPTPQCSLAAEYLHKQFFNLGFDPDFDEFQGIDVRVRLFDVFFLSTGIKGWAVGKDGLILYTDDGGQRWKRVNSPTNESLLSVDFVDSVKGWAVGDHGCIIYTTNGGISWELCPAPANTALIKVDFINMDIGWIIGSQVLRTTDGGNSWEELEIGAEDWIFMDGAFINEDTAWVIGWIQTGEERGPVLLHTADGGRTWSRQKVPVSEPLTTVDFIDSQKGWLAGDEGIILHTDDGGDNWKIQRGPIDEFEIFTDIDFINAKEGWAVGWRGVILHTQDGGNTWIYQNSKTKSILTEVKFVDSERGWIVGPTGFILFTKDGGMNWFSQPISISGNLIWRNIVATKTGLVNPQRQYILCGHYDSISWMPWEEAPGADDNASGVAAVMEIARILKDYHFRSTIKFICFSAEEVGHLGSRHYAEEALREGDQIAGVLNLDMIAYADSLPEDLDVVTNSGRACGLLHPGIHIPGGQKVGGSLGHRERPRLLLGKRIRCGDAVGGPSLPYSKSSLS